MTEIFESLDRRPLYTRVADSILTLIAKEGLRPGNDLPSEAELGKRAGVSRVVVRGALAHLAGAGHIKISNGRKAQVNAINPDTLANTFNHGLFCLCINRHRMITPKDQICVFTNFDSSNFVVDMQKFGWI